MLKRKCVLHERGSTVARQLAMELNIIQQNIARFRTVKADEEERFLNLGMS